MQTRLAPIIYIPHGGGPLPVLGDRHHQSLVDFLVDLPKQIQKPDAILMISAHWETDKPMITAAANPDLIYDYYNFPKAAYDIKYPASGSPDLAALVQRTLLHAGIKAELDNTRGFDHGMFVPLKLMYPQADIPCVQLSLLNSLDPQAHIDMGKALAPLRNKNILIIGSGMSFHNLQVLLQRTDAVSQYDEVFTQWLIETLCSGQYTKAEIEQRLVAWEQAPYARYCHPREEHLLPLHVCFGMAMGEKAHLLYKEKLMGQQVVSLSW